MTKLASGIQRELTKHFFLDEDGIRRIVGVLREKSASLPYKSDIVLAVRREDDRFYETLNVEDVLSDANTPDRRVQTLAIELRSQDPVRKLEPWDRNWVVQVIYKIGKTSSIQINIHSDDRDWALLLADTLEPQIARTLTLEKISNSTLWMLCAAITAFLVMCARTILPQLSFGKSLAESFEAIAWIAAVIFSLSLFDDERSEWLAKWAGPQSSFKWGDQVAAFEKCIERQKNIFWAVIVGFVVSIASTAYTTVMCAITRSQQRRCKCTHKGGTVEDAILGRSRPGSTARVAKSGLRWMYIFGRGTPLRSGRTR